MNVQHSGQKKKYDIFKSDTPDLCFPICNYAKVWGKNSHGNENKCLIIHGLTIMDIHSLINRGLIIQFL